MGQKKLSLTITFYFNNVIVIKNFKIVELSNFYKFSFEVFFFFRRNSMRIIREGSLGVSMFDPTCEHDTNPTRVFSG